MSVLVKKMKMPENCNECWFCDDEVATCLAVEEYKPTHAKRDGRMDWCPLVEVPTPHGRLVDIDKVIVEEDVYYQMYRVDAPTVIEEEE